MGSCLYINNNQSADLIQQEKSNQVEIIDEVSPEYKNFKSDNDTSTSMRKSGRRSRGSTKYLSCGQFCENIGGETNFKTFLGKSNGNLSLDNKQVNTLPRVLTYKTNTKYGITVYEVDNKIIDPNEVFYFENKEILTLSPRTSENIIKTPRASRESMELDKRITECISKNNSFEKLYEEVLSKKLCRKKN
jgi:hypothetical protein